MSVILTIIPYDFYPPQNGGSLRCFYLIREMSMEYDVYLLTVQPATDFQGDSEPVFPKNVTIISLYNAQGYKSLFNWLPGRLGDAINYRVLQKTFRTSANSYFIKAYPQLVQILKSVKPGIVLHENLESVTLFAGLVRKYLPTSKQIYDAHNIDSVLWRALAIAQKNKELYKYATTALETEKNLYKIVDGVFCCSEKEKEELMQLNNGKLVAWVIPNGVDTYTKLFDPNLEKYLNSEILFCGGMDYYPNEEGLFWFYNHAFPLVKKVIPNITLTLVGTKQIKENYQKLLSDPAVIFEGRVAEVKPFYYRASVCIAPLLCGSGTRLKILEAMSFGNPVVSTSIGAEGLSFVNGQHILVADNPQEFANNIIVLLQNKKLYHSIRNQARELVINTYNWKTIGRRTNDLLKSIVSNDKIRNYGGAISERINDSLQ
jgi:glycosyltransferase involved in cell wall biosynthesis